MAWEARPLPYKSLDGLSERQISEHYKLYQGYVNKQNEIHSTLNNVDWSQALPQANATYSEVRELKVEESFALNAIKLHEGYFLSLGGNGQPSGDAVKLIEMDFDSLDEWKNEFMTEGVCSRGWVICAYDWTFGCLSNYICDAHNLYNIWNSTPLVILDVYEHAYFADYGTNRKDYMNAWWNNLNWDHINSVIQNYGIMEYHVKHKAA
ncbi:MAG: superoxide dismutase [Actinobacteria bacterium]|nr:superoxide dismutase [Actinomycetota bacterium]